MKGPGDGQGDFRLSMRFSRLHWAARIWATLRPGWRETYGDSFSCGDSVAVEIQTNSSRSEEEMMKSRTFFPKLGFFFY